MSISASNDFNRAAFDPDDAAKFAGNTRPTSESLYRRPCRRYRMTLTGVRNMNHASHCRLAILVCSWALLTSCSREKQPSGEFGVRLDGDDIGGVVTSAKGPEPGVWVIAETADLETRFARIVVTDDQGRYVIPDLPAANYQVWVRGYGLVDSAKVASRPGNRRDLTAVVAPDVAAAARMYPAAYWYAMMKLPSESEVVQLKGGRNEYLMQV